MANDISPSAYLVDLRASASRAFVVVLWLHVALAGTLAASNGVAPRGVIAFAVLAALAGTLAVARAPSALGTRLVVAAALTAGPVLLVFAGRGPWQEDWHMYFFVIFGALVAYVDWRPIALSATLTALHHLLLDALFPGAVFSEPSFARIALHVAIVVATVGVLCLTVHRMRRLLDRLADSIATARIALDQSRLFRLAVDCAGDAVIISEFEDGATLEDTMRSQRTVYVNEAFTQLTGREAGELVGSNVARLFGPESDRKTLFSALAAVAGQGSVSFEFNTRVRDGRETTLECSTVAFEAGERGRRRWVTVARDVGERRRLAAALQRVVAAEETNVALSAKIAERSLVEQRLRHVALHDQLSGLPNRTMFLERLSSVLAAPRTGRCAVLFVDLDRFKVVNDALGHMSGDLLLVLLARRLESHAAEGLMLARLGGDEFAVLVENAPSADVVREHAGRMIEALREPFSLSGRDVYVSASIGIAFATDDTKNAEQLLRNADLAMYRAKSLGKGRYECFAPEMLERSTRLLALETDLQRALTSDELRVHFQPIVDLAGRAPRGFEALVRWQHHDGRLVPPGEFIPFAEESGLIVPIGAAVLDEACRQLRDWLDEFGEDDELFVSVNVSPQQLRVADFYDRVRATLERYRLASSRLHLEVTETVLMPAAGDVSPVLERLRELGISIAVDDFGTGYSSLGYLDRLPIDTLKIDRSFVSGRGEGIANLKIVRTVFELAQQLDLAVVTEGIETEAQAAKLTALGARFGQGFLFARPLEPGAATAFLRRSREPFIGPGFVAR